MKDQRIAMYEAPRRALDHMPVPALIIDVQSQRIVLSNSYACERFGYEPEEMRMLPLSIMFDSTPADAGGDAQAALTFSHDPNETRVRCRAKDGERVELPAVTQSLTDDIRTGRVLRTTDTLPRRIGTLDRRVQALLEFSYDAYSDYDILTGYIDFSAQMDRILGYPPGGAPRTFFQWAHLLHPGDRHRVLGELRDVLSGDSPQWTSEYRLRRRDGSYVLVLDQCIILVDEDGRPSHMVGAVRDITDERQAVRSLHESAELYRTLFLNSVNPAFRVSQDGCYNDVNNAGLRFFECTRPEFLARTAYADLPRDLLQLMRRGGPASHTELEREISVEVHGITKHLHITMVPAQVASQTTFFFFGTDITALKVLQEELQDRNAAIARSGEPVTLRTDRRWRHASSANLDESVTPVLDRLRRRFSEPARRSRMWTPSRTHSATHFQPLSLRAPSDDEHPHDTP